MNFIYVYNFVCPVEGIPGPETVPGPETDEVKAKSQRKDEICYMYSLLSYCASIFAGTIYQSKEIKY